MDLPEFNERDFEELMETEPEHYTGEQFRHLLEATQNASDVVAHYRKRPDGTTVPSPARDTDAFDDYMCAIGTISKWREVSLHFALTRWSPHKLSLQLPKVTALIELHNELTAVLGGSEPDAEED